MKSKLSCKNFVHWLGLCLLSFLFVLAPQIAKAQTATGAISGTVTDPNGLVMTGVGVTVRNTETGTRKTIPRTKRESTRRHTCSLAITK